jgi:hypothetical protein
MGVGIPEVIELISSNSLLVSRKAAKTLKEVR